MNARMDLMAALVAVNACPESRKWLAAERMREPMATRSQERWYACPRGDWVLWLAARAGVDRRLIARASCAVARTALVYVPAGELRPLRCIEVTEACTRGEATIEQVRVARDECWRYRVFARVVADAAAAHAAAAAAHAAAAAADADADDVADVAAAHADVAAHAADAAAARSRGLRASADIVRSVIPWADVERGLYLAAGGVL